MATYLANNPTLTAAYILLYIIAAINTLASILTIVLIYYMRSWNVLRINLYLEMVLTMTAFQTLYDSTFFLSLTCNEGPCASFYYTYFSVTGVAASMWSLLIICSVWWMIVQSKVPSASFMRVCWAIVAAVSIGILIGVEEYMRSFDVHLALNVYNYARVGIIAISVFLVNKKSKDYSR